MSATATPRPGLLARLADPAGWRAGTHELVFALKTTAGGLLALYIAFRLGLESPYWVLPTSFIVANPFAAAMRSKSTYRLVGTGVGGVMAVVLVPNLVDAPVLLSLALAAWIGLCLYLALLERSPRSYMFMLGGYTVGIIGFQAIGQPQGVFDIALARVEEIALGIGCTTLIGGIVLPRPYGPVVQARLEEWTKPALDWALHALAGTEPSSAALYALRDRLTGEAVEIGMMIPHLSYETAAWARFAGEVNELRQAVLSMVPVLSALGDRAWQLKRLGGMTPELAAGLEDAASWMRAGQAATRAQAGRLMARVKALEEAEPARDWAGVLRASLLARLRDLIGLVEYERALRRHIFKGEPMLPRHAIHLGALTKPVKASDHGLALFSSLGAAFTLLLLCGFWILSGWPGGAGAALMATIACCFFAALDDPTVGMRGMLQYSVVSVVAVALYGFVLLPRVENFEQLALVLTPYLLLAASLAARPATMSAGMVLGANGCTLMALQNHYAGDFAAFANAALGMVGGIGAAILITRIIRQAGVDWIVRRLLHQTWKDIATATSRPQDRAHFAGRLLDRLGLLLPRLKAAAPNTGALGVNVLRDVRNGLNALVLARELGGLPLPVRLLVGKVQERVARHYREAPAQAPEPGLRVALDAALAALAHVPHDQVTREVTMALVGLRFAFYPEAAPPLALEETGP